MGKSTEALTSHPVPHNLTNATPNILVGDASSIPPSAEPSTREALAQEYPRPNDILGHSMGSEVHVLVSGRTSTIADGLPPRRDIALGTEPLLTVGLPDSTLVPRSFVSTTCTPKSSTGALPTEAVRRLFPLNGNNLRLGLQARPKPLVKACVLSTGGPGIPVLLDAGLILQGLSCVPNLNPDHVFTRTSRLIDVALDKFFDPNDIRKGGILISIVSCHGTQSCSSSVLLQFNTRNGTPVDSRMLQEKIMALSKYCTLEVVVDTCCAEGVIPGLHRIFTMEPSAPCAMPGGLPDATAKHLLPSGSRPHIIVPASSAEPSALFSFMGMPNQANSLFEQDPPKYKAQAVVWAASAGSSSSFTEENLPQASAMYSILIGAIFKQLSSCGANISRRAVWENVLEVVGKPKSARRERDILKASELRPGLSSRTQRAILLTSVNNPLPM